MTHLQLRIYVDPSEAQIFVNLLRLDGNHETIAATIDTGAAVSLFSIDLLDVIAHRPTGQGTVLIDQAGIAEQFFEAVEALVTVSLEDESGNRTEPLEIPAWFADSDTPLIGFAGILDRAILHIDMPQRTGWLEIAI
jgi:hypothetical protein